MDRALRRLPARVGADDFLPSVFVIQIDHRAGQRLPEDEAAAEREVVAVKSVAQPEADAVRAVAELRGHVAGDVEGAHVIGGLRGGEHLVADPLTVDVKLVVAQPANVRGGPPHLARGGEFLAQQRRGVTQLTRLAAPRRRPVRRGSGGRDVSNPLRPGPIVVLEQRHFPGGRRRPRGRLALFIPHPQFPVAKLARGERFPGVQHVDALRGIHAAGAPEVGPFRRELRGSAGHQNFVGGLGFGPLRGAELPREARRGALGDGARRQFATQVREFDARRRRGVGGAQGRGISQDQREQQEGSFHRGRGERRRRQFILVDWRLAKSYFVSLTPLP